MTRTKTKTGRNNHRKHEQANSQNGDFKLDARPIRPSGAVTLKDVVQDYGRCVYAIARIRANPDGTGIISTIGSGFIAAPYRLITAAHVLDNPNPDAPEFTKHKDGDIYVFVRRDDSDRGHAHGDGR